MFKWLGQQPEKKKKTRQLWQREFNIVKEGLSEQQVVAFIDSLIAQHKVSQQATAASLRSLLKTAANDVQQMAASIKAKAQVEAEAEAARIINQAMQEIQGIKARAEIATQKEAEDILSATDRKAEITEVEAKQKALLFLLRAREDVEKEVKEQYKKAYTRLSIPLQDLMKQGQSIEMELKSKRAQLWEGKNFKLEEHEAALLKASEEVVSPLETPPPVEAEIEQPAQLQEEAPEEVIEQPAPLQEEAPEEVIEQPAPLQEEAPVSESVKEITEEPSLGKRSKREKPTPARLKSGDTKTLYTGEVELAIAIPVELKLVSKLYNHLQTTPEIKILHIRGSWDRGTTITVVLDKPTPLIDLISEIPDVEVIPQLPQKDSSKKRTSDSPLRAEKKGVQRIELTLKEGQHP